MKKIVYVFSLIFGVWSGSSVQGQGGYTLPQITPKSPNVAGFEKYGDVPVSLGRGMTNISIPLTSIKVDGLTIPISLTYHNTGLKVDEIPSWVGLGWDLQAGGMISYQQRGINDFTQYGLIGNSSSFQDLSNFLGGSLTSDQSFSYLERVISGQEDGEFDLYDLNFLGYTGTFYFDNYQQAHITPKSDMKILKTTNGLEVIDQSGNQFYFEAAENATMYPLSDVEIRLTFADISAFYISKIVTTNGRVVNFKYKSYNLQYNRTSQYIVHHPYVTSGCPGNAMSFADTYVSTDFLLLDSIVFDEGYVKFLTSTTYRQDLLKINSNDNVPSLSGIIVANSSGKIINQFNLSQGYFGSNDRLKLTAIQEQNNTTLGRNWQFGYYGDEATAFPQFFDKGKDHWGFYNGKQNSNLIPQADYGSFLLNWVDYLSSYGDRTSDFASSQLSMLKTIKYPTGGTTTFQYEPNQISVQQYSDITTLSPFFQLPTGTLTKVAIAGDWTNVQSVTGNGDEHTVTGTFTIPSNDVYDVRIYQDVDPSSFESPIINFTGPTASVAAIMHLLSQHTTTTSYQGEASIPLEAGTYTYSLTSGVYCYTTYCIPLQANFDISKWVIPAGSTVGPYVIGGCRIAKITSSDNTGVNPDIIRKYIYDDSLNHVVFRNIPSYFNQANVGTMLTGTTCSLCGNEYVVHDENVRPSVGSNIEYINVTELQDATGFNGKTDNTFSTSTDEGGSIYGEPFSAPLNTVWQSGDLISQKKYKFDGTVYSQVEGTNNSYFSSGKQNLQNGIRVDYRTSCPAISTLWTVHGVSLATLFVEQFYQNQSTVAEYLNGEIDNTTNTSCQSSNHVLPTLVETFDSKGESIREKTIYSFDYGNLSAAASSSALGIQKLVNLHILVPIEKVRIKNINGTDYVIDATLNVYKNDKPEIDKTYSLKLSSPLLYSSFVQSSIDGSGNFNMDSHYEERISFYAYDSYNNLMEVSKSDDKHISYIYDYKSIYPVAEVSNADNASIAYTSFEADGTGNWIIGAGSLSTSGGITGNNYYTLANGATITHSGLNSSRKYVVTYWSMNGPLTIAGTTAVSGLVKRGWTFYQHNIAAGSTTITISGSGIALDELRLFPADAQMKTYTFTPLIGMTSSSDPAGLITYYEYDDLNRLLHIRDIDNNILKKYEYQFQVFSTNAAVWQATGQIRCKPCPANGNYTIDMQQHQQTDINPKSSTYNTSQWIDDGIAGSCVITPDWQNITSLSCEINPNGSNTGNQQVQQQDMNPCSPHAGEKKWVVTGINGTACPYCNATSCTGTNHKCFFNTCQTGTLGIISQTTSGSGSNTHCTTQYGYFFSDGSYQYDHTVTNGGICP